MTFTPNPPTREGAYWFRYSEETTPRLLEVYKRPEGGLAAMGMRIHDRLDKITGLWSPRLVSVEEVKLAYEEAISDYFDKRTSNFELSWDESRARQVVEGNTSEL